MKVETITISFVQVFSVCVKRRAVHRVTNTDRLNGINQISSEFGSALSSGLTF